MLKNSTIASEETVKGCVFQVVKLSQLLVIREARMFIANVAGEFVPVISSVAELTVAPARFEGIANFTMQRR